MVKEITKQTDKYITHVFLQAGVGGMAGAMVAGIARYLQNIPETIIVEPDSAACVMESIKTGKIEKVNIHECIVEAIETLDRKYFNAYKIVKDFDPSIPKIAIASLPL